MAVRVLRDILHSGQPLDEVLARQNAGLMKSFAERDRGFVRAIVSASLRRRGQIEAILAGFLQKPLPRKSGNAREILLSGAAQLLFLETGAHAVIDLAVTLASEDRNARGFKGLINAVLRRVAAEGPALIADQDAARLNTPDWLWHRWRAHYGEDTAHRIAEAHLVEPPLDITVKDQQAGGETALAATTGLAARLGGSALAAGSVRLQSAGRIEAMDGFAQGQWWVQDIAASLPARLLGEVAGKHILDLCAAPGGKTAQLAAMGARVTAVDRSAHRLERLRENLSRLDLQADTVAADASSFMPETPPDAILLDAPCSATGTIRRHPDIAWLKDNYAVNSLTGIQEGMLRHAIQILPSGGLLIFCTCSLEPQEGENLIDTIISHGAPVERVPVLPGEIGGLEEAITPNGDVRTLPCHNPALAPDSSSVDAAQETVEETAASTRPVGMDGFFISRLRKQ